ncbi:MAG TPA: superoxide dismutase [Pseudonocardiaceae bacterium]
MTVHRSTPPRLTLAAVGAVVALMPMACAYQGLGMPAAPPASTPAAHAGPALLYGSGTLASPKPESTAVTYNPSLAPVGAVLTASLSPVGDSTTVNVAVGGMLPNRGYAVHAHTKACGATGDAAGPHYQNRLDPAATPQAPSSNPEYANPTNEIWLEVGTDGTGSGTAHTTVPFVFADRAPASIVVHEATMTSTGPGQAGKAGARVACLTLTGG